MDLWYRNRLMLQTWTHGVDMDSWYRYGLMVLTDSWYRHGLIVLTTPMVLTQTHGVVSVLLNHTRKRGPSVAFLCCNLRISRQRERIESYHLFLCLLWQVKTQQHIFKLTLILLYNNFDNRLFYHFSYLFFSFVRNVCLTTHDNSKTFQMNKTSIYLT